MSSRHENNLLSGDKTWEGHQKTCVSEYYSNLKSEAEQLGEALIQYANPMWCWCCIKMQKQILLALGVRLRFGDLFPSRANSKPGKRAIYEIHEKQSLRARFTKTELGGFCSVGRHLQIVLLWFCKSVFLLTVSENIWKALYGVSLLLSRMGESCRHAKKHSGKALPRRYSILNTHTSAQK